MCINRIALVVVTIAVLALIMLFGGAVYVWEEFFGSDEIEHYTARYTWFANQASHFMMGFCIMAFVWAIFARGYQRTGLFSARNVVFIPIIFVFLKDFALDIARDIQMSSGAPLGHGVAGWGNVFMDGLTDNLFWIAGFCLAMIWIGCWVAPEEVCTGRWLAAFIVCCVGLIGLSGLWISQKDTFDQSGLPLNYTRLGPITRRLKFPEGREQEHIDKLRLIRDAARCDQTTHVVLFNGSPRDRADLAVSIGCEYAFRIRGWGTSGTHAVASTTAARLLEDQSSATSALTADPIRCVVVTDLDTSSVPPLVALLEAAYQSKKPELFSGGIRNQLDLNNFLRNLPGNNTAVYDREKPLTLNDLELLYTKYHPQAPGIHASPRVLEVRQAFVTRSEKFIELGAIAKRKKLSTVWAFADVPAWLGEECDPSEERRLRNLDRLAWIHSLAYLLDVKPSELIQIELRSTP